MELKIVITPQQKIETYYLSVDEKMLDYVNAFIGTDSKKITLEELQEILDGKGKAQNTIKDSSWHDFHFHMTYETIVRNAILEYLEDETPTKIDEVDGETEINLIKSFYKGV